MVPLRVGIPHTNSLSIQLALIKSKLAPHKAFISWVSFKSVEHKYDAQYRPNEYRQTRKTVGVLVTFQDFLYDPVILLKRKKEGK